MNISPRIERPNIKYFVQISGPQRNNENHETVIAVDFPRVYLNYKENYKRKIKKNETKTLSEKALRLNIGTGRPVEKLSTNGNKNTHIIVKPKSRNKKK